MDQDIPEPVSPVSKRKMKDSVLPTAPKTQLPDWARDVRNMLVLPNGAVFPITQSARAVHLLRRMQTRRSKSSKFARRATMKTYHHGPNVRASRRANLHKDRPINGKTSRKLAKGPPLLKSNFRLLFLQQIGLRRKQPFGMSSDPDCCSLAYSRQFTIS